MKPFDLEAAKSGDPIVCRDGTPAKFIAHVPEASESSRLVVMIGTFVVTLRENGKYFLQDVPDDADLFMAPKKRIVWVNFYEVTNTAKHFSTEEEAEQRVTCIDYQGKVRPRVGGKAYPVEIQE